MNRRRKLIALGATVAVLTLAAAAFWFGPFRDGGDDGSDGAARSAAARVAAESFAANWQAGTLEEVAFAPGGVDDMPATSGLITGGLEATGPAIVPG